MSAFSNHFYTDWSFYKRMLAITIPIALQNVISLSVNMMDTVMLGQLGDVAIAASNLGGQLFTILDVLGFGMASGAAVLIAQYWGKRDLVRIRQIFALTLRIALGVSLLFALVGHFFPQQVLRIYTTDPLVIEAGSQYLRWLSFSFVLFSFSNCYIMCLRAVEQVRVSMMIYGSSFLINIFFNYCFIFGKLGAPALGVRGAALGTVLARLFELCATLVYMCFVEKRVGFTPIWLFRLKSGLLRDYIRNSVPVVSNELLWGIGMSVMNLTIGHMGPSFTSAMSIVIVFNQLVSVFVFGMSAATAVIVGKTIGEGRIQDAQRAANSSVLVSLCLSFISMTVLLVGRPYILGMYNVSQLAHDTAFAMLTILALMQPFQAVGCVMVVGVLRGGGDVRSNLILDSGLQWCLAIPLGLLTGFVLHWSAPAVFFCMRSDNLAKSLLGLWRLRSGRWIRVVTKEET
ncbi:MATE family efflux transporter [uncultured Allofournierella sp.]|uniref:MATE family efflux transporter n=1 Tax=uncultured Allofournierella sp. TaxID=1940258 RepID=UPI00374FF176